MLQSLFRAKQDPIPAGTVERWFDGKDFTTDWLSKKISPWFAALAPLKDKPVRILEVGSFEGRSAVALLNILPLGHITCIDTFSHDGVEDRFDFNLAPFGQRVRKIKSMATEPLEGMRRKRETFDVVYLDAGKGRDWNFLLSTLVWPLVSINGTIIWDDLTWGGKKPPEERPGDAIRLFTRAFSDCLVIVHEGKQLIARKTKDWP